MSREIITVHVKMDLKTLRSFAVFNDIILKKRFVRPAVFAAILLFFSIICYASGKEQSALLGTLLMVLALGMPLVYFGTFLSQIKSQAKKLRLNPPRKVYTLALKPDGVHIQNDMRKEENVDLPWDKWHGAYRLNTAIYLYATPQRAFILPNGQADAAPQEVWQLIETHLPQGRAQDCTKKRKKK